MLKTFFKKFLGKKTPVNKKREPISKIAKRLAVGECVDGKPIKVWISKDGIGIYWVKKEEIEPAEAKGYEDPRPDYYGPFNWKQANEHFDRLLRNHHLKEITTMEEYNNWYDLAYEKAKEIHKAYLLSFREQELYCPYCKKGTTHEMYYDVWRCKVCGRTKRYGTGDEDNEN
ncbi:hypothetical protein J7J95_03050 [bacterium]|nr:hypothetical protein [bacterium]